MDPWQTKKNNQPTTYFNVDCDLDALERSTSLRLARVQCQTTRVLGCGRIFATLPDRLLLRESERRWNFFGALLFSVSITSFVIDTDFLPFRFPTFSLASTFATTVSVKSDQRGSSNALIRTKNRSDSTFETVDPEISPPPPPQ